MLQNVYFLAKIGADTAENEQHFAEMFDPREPPDEPSSKVGRTVLHSWPLQWFHQASFEFLFQQLYYFDVLGPVNRKEH